MITALALVGIISGAVLVLVYVYSKPKIKENLNAETGRAIQKIFPNADMAAVREKAPEVEKSVLPITDNSKKVIGYAFMAEGNGYQGTIKLLVGVNGDFSKLIGIEVLESSETPGLGAEITGDPFKDQFKGLSLSQPIEYVKNQKPETDHQIEAITGATISSRAVVNIINGRVEEARKEAKKLGW